MKNTKLAGKIVEVIKNNNLGGKEMNVKVELKGALNKVETMMNGVSDMVVESGVVKGELNKPEVINTELVEAQEKADKVLTMLQRMAEQEFNKVAVKHPEFSLLDEKYVVSAKTRVVENADAIIDITSDDIVGDIAKYALICIESAISDSINDRVKQLTANLTSVLKQNTSSLTQMIALENMAPELLLNIIAGASNGQSTQEVEENIEHIASDMQENEETETEVEFVIDDDNHQQQVFEEQKQLLANTMIDCKFILEEDHEELAQDKKALIIVGSLDVSNLKGSALIKRLTDLSQIIYKEYHDDRNNMQVILNQASSNLSEKHKEMFYKVMSKTINKNSAIDDLEYFRLLELFGQCE